MLATGAKGNPNGQGAPIVRVAEEPAQITLAEVGIDKNLAVWARTYPRFCTAPAYTIR